MLHTEKAAVHLVRVQHILDCHYIWVVRTQRLFLDHKRTLQQRSPNSIVTLCGMCTCLWVSLSTGDFSTGLPQCTAADAAKPVYISPVSHH